MNKLRQILSGVLILALLISVVGINIHHHICTVTGRHFISILERTDCHAHNLQCCEENQESDDHNSCCTHHSESTGIAKKRGCYDFNEYKAVAESFVKLSEQIIEIPVIIIELNTYYTNEINVNKKFIPLQIETGVIKFPILKIITFIHNSAQCEDSPAKV
jgi:hypothetical protein